MIAIGRTDIVRQNPNPKKVKGGKEQQELGCSDVSSDVKISNIRKNILVVQCNSKQPHTSTRPNKQVEKPLQSDVMSSIEQNESKESQECQSTGEIIAERKQPELKQSKNMMDSIKSFFRFQPICKFMFIFV